MNTKTRHNTTFDKYSWIWLAILTLVLFIPAVASFNTNHKHRSQWEKRELAQMPHLESIQAIDEYFLKMDAYLNDHIGFALDSNKLYRKILFYVFRQSPIANITYGKNGFLYLNSHSTKTVDANLKSTCIRGTDPQFLPGIKRKLDAIFEHFERREYPVYFGIATTKIALYPENLPDNTTADILDSCKKYSAESNNMVFLGKAYSGNRVFYYPLQELLKLKDAAYFYPKESFHWHGMSAHVFSKGLLARMGIMVDDSLYEEKNITTINSDLTGLGFTLRVTAWSYPYTGYETQQFKSSPSSVKQFYQRAIEFSEFDTSNAVTQETALVLSNSFGAYTVPHLAPGFKKLYHINLNHLTDDEGPAFYDQLIDSLHPDKIIFIFEDSAIISETALPTILKYIK